MHTGELWDIRYMADEYIYGKAPNMFFKSRLDKLEPGSILLPGEGEGRNAVYAAERGWNVTAFDISKEGRKKALQLAADRGVFIDYRLMPYTGFSRPDSLVDVIGLFFTHQPSKMRRDFHRSLQSLVHPEGVILLEAFHKDQIKNDTGGPKDIDFLFDETGLRADFPELEMVHLETLPNILDEGTYHQGEAIVVQMIARRNESSKSG